ncbi:MAG: S26 family signal peptidase, partial [Chloroflexota bacterium]
MQKTDTIQDATSREFLLWVFRLRKRYCVRGHSMEPLFRPGDEVLINHRAYRSNKPTENDLVVAQHPNKPEVKLIKRVATVQQNGACFLVGDNP